MNQANALNAITYSGGAQGSVGALESTISRQRGLRDIRCFGVKGLGSGGELESTHLPDY